ncbi:nucleotidyltransferase domain-containing protein [Candidatus Palauibacter sp.]|uniref:nucleotidyltransferase domain-containing protein n=1 Tax=Candidatus Palauibacter sp. TaxID=3101350 RepID=UPI003AF251F2
MPEAAHQAVLDEVVRRVVEVASPEKIILFGSAARGQMDPDSDLDLLIIAETENPRHLMGDIYRRLYGVGIAVDALVATPEHVERHRDTNGLVFKSALDEGRVVYDTAAPDPWRPLQVRRRPQFDGAVDPALLAEVVRRVVEAAGPEKIVLFGPAARSRMAPNADIGLLIIAETEDPRRTTTTIYRKLCGVGVGVTAVVSTPAHVEQHKDIPGLVFQHALERGKVVYDTA